MIINKNFFSLFFSFVIVLSVVFPAFSEAEEPVEIFTLKQTIENAIKANIGLQSSREGTRAALFAKKYQRTYFLPTFSATYRYKRTDEEIDQATDEIIVPEDEYTFIASITQPLFTGFELLNQYKIASLGLDVAKINEKLVRQGIIFEAKNLFFSILKAQKIMSVSQEAVTLLTAHKEVAKNFYQVGMTPLNDLLKAQVELANTKQDFIIAQNNLDIAKSNFNIFLRRPINLPVQLEDVLDYTTFGYNIDYCLGEAEKNRLEITTADLNVEIGEKELKLSRKDYYPSISLQGNYYRMGTEPDLSGEEGIIYPSSWDIQAVATWNFWEWGRSHYGVKEKKSRLLQARHQKEEIRDSIRLEVKQAFLKTRESEKNIVTVNEAVEQAKENFRISEERYKEQMATSTDVLDAQTLLSKTKTNYYNALYDYKISKAALYRAMGQEIIE
jgi:outer membrane protein TolC